MRCEGALGSCGLLGLFRSRETSVERKVPVALEHFVPGVFPDFFQMYIRKLPTVVGKAQTKKILQIVPRSGCIF